MFLLSPEADMLPSDLHAPVFLGRSFGSFSARGYGSPVRFGGCLRSTFPKHLKLLEA